MREISPRARENPMRSFAVTPQAASDSLAEIAASWLEADVAKTHVCAWIISTRWLGLGAVLGYGTEQTR
ncbi:MAG: hypothetical protein AAFO93_00900 [Pseudomonadota bacterium]